MNFQQFSKVYLSHLYPLPFASFHLEIIELLQSAEERRIVILVPREHGKTTLLVGFVIYALLSRLYHLILYISQSQEQARRLASTIKLELELNPKILEDFGDIRGGDWTVDSLEVKNGCRLLMRGVGAGLRGLNIRGKRPDLIILDDVETDKHHYSALESERLKRIFKNAILNLGKDAKIVVVGTMGGKHGLLYELSQYPFWKVIHYKAVENNKPLWPEKWSLQDLERKRMEIGDIAFSREFLNEIVETETLFKPIEVEELPIFSNFTAGLDFATGKGTDYNAIVIIGWINNSKGIVIYSKQVKNPDIFIQEVINQYKTYKFTAFAESNNFQSLLVERLAKEGVAVQPITTTRSKYERFLEMSTKINTGLIKMHSRNFDLLKQLQTYPFVKNDDLLDALYFAISYKKPELKILW